LALTGRSSEGVVLAEYLSTYGSACLQRLVFGRQSRTSRGAAKFFFTTNPSASAAFAQIAKRIPGTRALMNSAPAGMPKYLVAANAGTKA
jgi:hypothetical protein